jgi:hypothetical protein
VGLCVAEGTGTNVNMEEGDREIITIGAAS